MASIASAESKQASAPSSSPSLALSVSSSSITSTNITTTTSTLSPPLTLVYVLAPVRRFPVRSDGGCLFRTVIILLDLSLSESDLRQICVDLVKASWEAVSVQVEGVHSVSSAEAYSALILQEDTWGSLLELQLLAQHLGVRFLMVNLEEVFWQEFGGGSQTGYLAHTGSHYEPLVRGEKKMFSSTDDETREAMIAFAKLESAKYVRAYKCEDCGKPLRSNAAMLQHIEDTAGEHCMFEPL